jgi:hypothetical protein
LNLTGKILMSKQHKIFLTFLAIISFAIPFNKQLFVSNMITENLVWVIGFLVLIGLMFFFWQKVKFLLAFAPLLVIIIGIIYNISVFRKIDKSSQWQLTRFSSNNLFDKLQVSHSTSARATYGAYFFLESFLANKHLNVYRTDVLVEDRLKFISHLNAITYKKYNHTLTTNQVKRLLRLKHKRWIQKEKKDIVIIISSQPEYYVFDDDKTLFFIPTSLALKISR